MKYYLCINEIEEKKENSDVNWFIQYTFSASNSSGYYDVNEKQYGFRKNYIYHTTSYSDDYIVDDNGKSHKVLSVVPKYFVLFEFVVDERIKKIQKKKKDDLIEITPSYIGLNGTIKYRISCKLQIGKHTKCCELYSYSQYEGVIECYKRLRTMDGNYRLWYNVIHHHFNIKIWDILVKMC